MAGGGAMPAYAGNMTDEELNALLEILLSPMTPAERAGGQP